MAPQARPSFWWQSLVLPILDAESGVYRADFLSCRLSEELLGGKDGGSPFSMLLVEGQPSYGRRLKPASVRAAASALLSTARQEDVPARMGPRLFALLLPGVDETAAARLADVLEADLHLSTAGTGDSWRVACLGYPAQRDHLERLAADVAGRAQSRASHARPRTAA